VRGVLDAGPDPRSTVRPGLPVGEQLEIGVKRAGDVLGRPGARLLLAASAWPFFSFTTTPLLPAAAAQVSVCVTSNVKHAEKAMRELRHAIWGRAAGQDAALVVELLIGRGLLTLHDVRDVRHDSRRCGHRLEQLGPPRWGHST
jgi:hypothetical protein